MKSKVTGVEIDNHLKPFLLIIIASCFLIISCSKPVSVELGRAQELAALGKFDQSAKYYKRVIRRTKDKEKLAAMLIDAAEVEFATGDDDTALDYLKRVIDLDALSNAAVASHRRRAEIFIFKKQPNDAILELAFLVRRFPDHPDRDNFVSMLSETKLSAGELDDAMRLATSVIASPDPMAAERASFVYAEGLLLSRRWDDAISAYRHFIQRFPRSSATPEAVCRMAQAYQAGGESGSAKKVLEKWALEYPKSPAIKNCAKGMNVFIEGIGSGDTR